jgi:succinyl-CoA synthetase beta subunit
MKIHEYQGKELLKKYGVAVPRGVAAFTVDEAVAAAESLGGRIWVVKAQIHAGGRGKGGGVKLARSLDEVRTLSGRSTRWWSPAPATSSRSTPRSTSTTTPCSATPT